jgi:hypothetical protein
MYVQQQASANLLMKTEDRVGAQSRNVSRGRTEILNLDNLVVHTVD